MGKRKGPKHGIWGKMGRPNADIDKAQFEKLCVISPTLLECCAIFQVDEVTLNAWCTKTYGETFSQVLPKLGATGKISLRRKIWQLGLEKEKEFALKMLANKHLKMSDSPTVQAQLNIEEIGEENNQTKKEIKVIWNVSGSSEGTDHFDK